MVRSRSLVIVGSIALGFFACALLSAVSAADGASSPKPKPDQSGSAAKPSAKGDAKSSKTLSKSSASIAAKPVDKTPLGLKPYRIRVWLEIDPMARISERGRQKLLYDWKGLVHRLIGPPWELTVEENKGPLTEKKLEALTAADFADWMGDFDKAWVVRVAPRRSGYEIVARECDGKTTRLAMAKRRYAPHPADAPRALFELSLDVFAPTADIGESKDGGVTIEVQGSQLPVAGPLGQFLAKGSVFRPLRIYLRPDNTMLQILDIPWSYLRVEKVEGSKATCRIVSNLGDPLTKAQGQAEQAGRLGSETGRHPSQTSIRHKARQKARRRVCCHSATDSGRQTSLRSAHGPPGQG